MSLEIDYPGRFGNNLFQYVFARLLARRNNLELLTQFNHPSFVATTPHESGHRGEGTKLKLTERTSLTKPVPPSRYWIQGFFQNADYYWPNKKEIIGFAKPATEVKPRPIGDLVVNFRIDWDYRKVAIHPSWYRKILKQEPYDRLFVVADHEDAVYWHEALKGHKYEVFRGNPKEQWDFLRSFRKMVASNSTFTWWAVFMGYSERTYVFKDWIRNGLVKLTKFPGAIEVPGKMLHEQPLHWVDPEEDEFVPPLPLCDLTRDIGGQLEGQILKEKKRNLVYYIYPKCPEGWRWHVKRIQDFWQVFTGRKRVLISVDDHTEAADVVKSAFSDKSIDFEVVNNDPQLWETKHFINELSKIESSDPNEITFYAHAKGVIHNDEQIRRVWKWCDAMYLLNLSCAALVDRVLSHYDSMGCFKFPPKEWFYAGTFFWFKHSSLFSKNWRRINTDKYAVERYLAFHIDSEKAYTMSPFLGGGELYGNPPNRSVVLGWLQEHMARAAIRGFEDIKKIQLPTPS